MMMVLTMQMSDYPLIADPLTSGSLGSDRVFSFRRLIIFIAFCILVMISLYYDLRLELEPDLRFEL